jgi:TonB family protein
MTMAMQAVNVVPTGPKVLRIGVIQGGKIVEERIIRKRETVSIGSSERNHFVVASLPPRFDLFQLVGNDYILNFTEEMKGRVGLPGGVQDLQHLRQSGGARNAGTHWQVKLNDNSRGKVTIGDTTLLFQFVSPPPVTPRPQLPAAVRGGFVKGIDWVFTAFVTFSFMIHFGFIIYLENADWPLDEGIGEIPEAISRMIFEEPTPPPVPEETPQTEETPTETAETTPAEQPQQPQQRSTSSGQQSASRGENSGSDSRSNAEATARIAAEAAAAAEQLLVGALGGGAESALNDVLRGGAVTGNAADVLAQASGVGVASGGTGGQLRTRGGGGTGSGEGGLGSLAAAGGAGATQQRQEGAEVVEVRVRGNLRFLDSDGDMTGSGDFDQRVVVNLIRQRISAIRACYERELRRNPQLSGKVTVEFTIQTTGTVSGVRATENTTGDDAVAACVVSTVQRFRFNPGPEGGSVTFSYPFVFAPQN